jgi:hypothetical protein
MGKDEADKSCYMKKIVHSKKVPRLLVADTGQTKRMPEITPELLESQGFSPTLPKRFWAKVQKAEGCWLWTGSKDSFGYGKIYCGTSTPRTGRKNWTMRTHIFSWILRNGPVPSGMCVLHHCDNPPCVNPAHLWLGSRGDNNKDALRKGRNWKPSGEQHHKSKITTLDVIEIRKLRQSGSTFVEISKLFPLDETNLSRICQHKTWKHVK